MLGCGRRRATFVQGPPRLEELDLLDAAVRAMAQTWSHHPPPSHPGAAPPGLVGPRHLHGCNRVRWPCAGAPGARGHRARRRGRGRLTDCRCGCGPQRHRVRGGRFARGPPTSPVAGSRSPTAELVKSVRVPSDRDPNVVDLEVPTAVRSRCRDDHVRGPIRSVAGDRNGCELRRLGAV